MRVARLEIFGFKSFMERLVLPLEGGITAIVGPNGCGKSNVVDAIRWVLGESRASNLRGGLLEDVIFNGTDKLRPMGLAEVTMTLRASGEDFFTDMISNVPSFEIDAEIPEAGHFTDPGSVEAGSADAANVLSGGQAAAEVRTSAGGDERAVVPHLRVLPGRGESRGDNADSTDTASRADALSGIASGVSAESVSEQVVGGKDGGEERTQPAAEGEQSGATAKTLSTQALTRFAWLKSVSEVQITRRLYRSGESEFFINRVPCRLRDIKDLFRAVGLSARAYTIVAQGEVGRIVTARPEERRLILEEAAGVVGLRDKIASARRRLEETEINISRLDDIIKEVSRQVASLKRQSAIARNREQLKLQIRDFEGKIASARLHEMRKRALSMQQELEQIRSVEEASEMAAHAAQSQEEAARAELMSVDVQGDQIRSRIDQIRDELDARVRRRSSLTSRVNELRAFALARETEIRRLEERRGTLIQRREETERESLGLQEQEHALQEQLRELEAIGDSELQSIAAELYQVRDELKRKELALRASRDKFIAAQSRAESAQQQLESASPVMQLRKMMGDENKDFLSDLGRGATLFADSLKVPSEFAKAVQSVLGEHAEFLVAPEPLSIAEHFVERAARADPTNKRGLALGLLKEGLANPHTDAGLSSSLDVPFPRLIDQIEVAERVSLVTQRLLAGVFVVPSLAQAKQYLDSLGEEALQHSITLVTRDGEIVTPYSFYVLRNDGGLIQLKTRLEDLRRMSDSLQQEQAELDSAREVLQLSLNQSERAYAEALRQAQSRQGTMRELGNQLGNVRGRLHAGQRILEQVGIDSGRLQQQLEEARARIAEYRAEEQQVLEQIAMLESDQDQDLRAELERLQVEYSGIEAIRRKGREQLSQLAHALNEARRALDRSRARLAELQLEEQRVGLEVQNLRERLAIEFGDDFFGVVSALANAESQLDTAARAEASSEVQRMRARVNREGDVDPSSIERCDAEVKRLEDLEAQRKDLDEAAHTLKRTIERLTETSVQRFLETFEAVRENFSRLIPRLFGGGKGTLELSDPSNPLESGVDVVARPPGKKLKSIELLSGGEKAMCATALILGMFIVRPSPMCVLDEVDAPLDEANVVRFVSLIKEMSTKVQFLMITHNKNSMTVSDHLVGVTMQEPGASKVISVSLQEAYSQVA